MNLKERYQAAIKRLEEAETSEQVEQAKAELAVLKEAMDAAAEARAQLAGLAPASPKSTMAGQAKALPLTPGAAAAAHVRESGVTIREKFAFSAETKAAAPMGINPGSADSPVIAATTDVDTRIVEGYRRPLMIADLFGSETISGNALTYYVESPTVEGGPSTVAEKGLKPLTSFGDPTPVTVALQKVGMHYKESAELIEDTPWLASSIDGRGMYLHELCVENTLLTWLLGTSGLGATTLAAGTAIVADDIFKSMMKVQQATGFAADAVVLNPIDYQALRLSKDDNRQYLAGGPFYGQYGNGTVAEQPPLWGLRTVVTPAVAQGTSVVGAFKLGGSVIRRGGVIVNVANTNEDDFVKNLITILIEERLALAVRYPGAFDKISVAE